MTNRKKYKQLTTGIRQSSVNNPTTLKLLFENIFGWQTSVRRKNYGENNE